MDLDAEIDKLDETEAVDDDTESDPRGRYNPEDVATDEDIAAEKVTASDDTEAWTQRCAPFLALIRDKGPHHMRAIKSHATKLHVPIKLAEECIFWLENRGELVKFKRWDGTPTWRLPGFDAQADAPDEQRRTPVADRKPLIRSVAMAKQEWVSVDEAMKIVEVCRSRLNQLGRAGTIKSRKVGGKTSPREFLRSSLLEYQPNFMAGPEAASKADPPPRVPKKQRAAVQRKPRAANPYATRPSEMRWVLDGVKLGRFTAEQALEQITEIFES